MLFSIWWLKSEYKPPGQEEQQSAVVRTGSNSTDFTHVAGSVDTGAVK